MDQVDVNEVKAQFSCLMKRVEAGEEVVISRAGLPIARVVPYHSVATDRKPGTWRGKVTIAGDFDETLDWLIAAFEGRSV